jgi:hypothetical protein
LSGGTPELFQMNEQKSSNEQACLEMTTKLSEKIKLRQPEELLELAIYGNDQMATVGRLSCGRYY